MTTGCDLMKAIVARSLPSRLPVLTRHFKVRRDRCEQVVSLWLKYVETIHTDLTNVECLHLKRSGCLQRRRLEAGNQTRNPVSVSASHPTSGYFCCLQNQPLNLKVDTEATNSSAGSADARGDRGGPIGICKLQMDSNGIRRDNTGDMAMCCVHNLLQISSQGFHLAFGSRIQTDLNRTF